ncbi:MAG: aminotransferase [Planctomycetaceae bacterium]|nr:aminotransferase [Planctomycetaceae bacterium]
MREQEVRCFANAFRCELKQIEVIDLLTGAPTPDQLQSWDAVLLGGSGEYSVAEGGPWLPAALAAMHELYALAKPTFASCWGFQAMAKAFGGEVVTDASRAELGSVVVTVTQAGRKDDVFQNAGEQFMAQMGHQDIVTRLPEDAVLLASSELVTNQAFRLRNKPIYATQFHPELNREALIERVEAYPHYIEKIAGMTVDEFERTHCQQTPIAEQLLRDFIGKYVIRSRTCA